MSGPARVAAFAVLLVAIFGGAALAGAAIGPSGTRGGDDAAGAHGGEHTPAAAGGKPASGDASAPPGLQVAQDGYRLVLEPTTLERAGREPVRFRIVTADGQALRDFEIEHEKRMHFIVARRDLRGFQHLHPTMRADGTWETGVNFAAGGTYRVFADFKAAGAKRTLGADVHVPGAFRPGTLPPPASSARTQDGLEVILDAQDARAGKEGRVEFRVRRDGRAVDAELQPYLGAKGHLVALREGDLAYLHTHPESDRLAFMAGYPTAGAYRLFVQFLYRDRVQTAAFTIEVAQ